MTFYRSSNLYFVKKWKLFNTNIIVKQVNKSKEESSCRDTFLVSNEFLIYPAEIRITGKLLTRPADLTLTVPGVDEVSTIFQFTVVSLSEKI